MKYWKPINNKALIVQQEKKQHWIGNLKKCIIKIANR